ncbi:MAG: hypothetical protein RL030_2164, partial [Pseudomonadota bacterium]
MTVRTLNELMRANRGAPRSIHYHSGENESRRFAFSELHDRALGILHHLQKLGARPGDHMILLLNNDQQFIESFWAAVLGGIVPVPVAVGISDEHRHKLLRIALKLGQPFICTEHRAFERVGTFSQGSPDATAAATFAQLRERAFFPEDLKDLGQAGTPHEARPEDIAFIQFSSGSTSDPKGVVLTHANLIANAIGATEAAGFSETDVTLSWMPLTHDMGLIGMHLIM